MNELLLKLIQGMASTILVSLVVCHFLFLKDIFSQRKSLLVRIFLMFVFGVISSTGGIFSVTITLSALGQAYSSIYGRTFSGIYIDAAIIVVFVGGLYGGFVVGGGSAAIGSAARFFIQPASKPFLFITVLAGFLGSICHLFFKKERINPLHGLYLGGAIGVFQFLLTAVISGGTPELLDISYFTLPFVVLNSAGVAIFILILNNFQSQIEKARIEEIAAKTKLKFLQSQIKPHFLFNALNAVAATCKNSPDTARKVIENLSDYLRVSFKNKARVKLKEEIDFLKNYLDIEKVRFQDNLNVKMDVDKSVLDSEVPHIFIQPIVENCIKHGMGDDKEKIKIDISFKKRDDKKIFIKIEDDGEGIPEPKLKSINENSANIEGVGIRNIRERLKNIYGESASFRINSEVGKGTIVEILIPEER